MAGPDRTATSIEAAIAEAKQKKTTLEALADSFSSINDRIENKRKDLCNMETQINALAAERAGLGLFGGKEKKRIDLELAELDSKRKEVTSDIEQLIVQLKGYTSELQIEAALSQLEEYINRQEEKLREERDSKIIKYSYEDALEYYRSNPDIVHNVCPAIEFKFSIPGDSVHFGAYMQKDGRTKEPIEWQILETEDNRILIISKHALDNQPYNTEKKEVTWEACSLRKWLNGTFLNTAFSSEEQKLIKTVAVSADKNPNYDTDPGKDTKDQVFLLSVTEVNQYFRDPFFSIDDLQCKGTEYCYTQQEGIEWDNGYCWWWLRSPGYEPDDAAYVDDLGNICSYGYDVNMYCEVRPALWINLDSLLL